MAEKVSYSVTNAQGIKETFLPRGGGSVTLTKGQSRVMFLTDTAAQQWRMTAGIEVARSSDPTRKIKLPNPSTKQDKRKRALKGD